MAACPAPLPRGARPGTMQDNDRRKRRLVAASSAAGGGGASRAVHRAGFPPPVVHRPRRVPGAVAGNPGDRAVHLERHRLRLPGRDDDHAAPPAHGAVRRLPRRAGRARGRADGAAHHRGGEPAVLARRGAARRRGRARGVASRRAELRQRPRLGGGQPGAADDDRPGGGNRAHGRRHVGRCRHQQCEPAARPDARRRDPRRRRHRRRVLGERRALRRGAPGGADRAPARPRRALPPARACSRGSARAWPSCGGTGVWPAR